MLGHLDSESYLAAAAISGQMFNFAISVCAFLSMGTISLIANALGDNKPADAVLWGLRSTSLGIVVSAVMLAVMASLLIDWLSFIGARDQTFDIALRYSEIRLWGLVPAIMMYPLQGIVLGFHQSRWVMLASVAMSVSNAALSILLAWVYDFREVGVAWASVVSTWLAVIVSVCGVWGVVHQHKHCFERFQWRSLVAQLGYLVAVKRNLLIRSICIMSFLQLMIKMSTELSEAHIAATGILMSLIAFSSRIQDAFVTTVQMITAKGWSAYDAATFQLTHSRLKQWVLIISLAIVGFYAAFGATLIGGLTPLAEVVTLATDKLWIVLLYITFVSWTYFYNACLLGMTETAKLRNTYLTSLLIFVGFIVFVYQPAPTFSLLWVGVLCFEVVRLVMLKSCFHLSVRKKASACSEALMPAYQSGA